MSDISYRSGEVTRIVDRLMSLRGTWFPFLCLAVLRTFLELTDGVILIIRFLLERTQPRNSPVENLLRARLLWGEAHWPSMLSPWGISLYVSALINQELYWILICRIFIGGSHLIDILDSLVIGMDSVSMSPLSLPADWIGPKFPNHVSGILVASPHPEVL